MKGTETMAKAKVVKGSDTMVTLRVPREMIVPLPKERGTIPFDWASIPDAQRDGLAAHALGAALKRRFEDASGGDSSGMYDRAIKIRARMYAGEWNLPGGRTARDAIALETLAILARNAGAVGLDPKSIVKGTIREGVARVVIAAATKAGKVFDLPELTAVIDRNLAAIEARARKTVEERASVDVSID